MTAAGLEMRRRVAANVRRARTAAGLSQRRCARDAGVSAQAVWAIEAGKSGGRTDTLAAIAAACGTTAEALLAPLDNADAASV